MDDPVLAYLSLGSNLGDRLANLRTGVARLSNVDGVELQAVSSLYETSPVGGPRGQPPFLNAAVLVSARIQPHSMLKACKAIEVELGRDPRREGEVRWGPRTLDVDILTWGNSSIETPELVVPHPRIYERLFVLLPVLEIGLFAGTGIDSGEALEAEARIRSRGDQVAHLVQGAGWWRDSPVPD